MRMPLVVTQHLTRLGNIARALCKCPLSNGNVHQRQLDSYSNASTESQRVMS